MVVGDAGRLAKQGGVGIGAARKAQAVIELEVVGIAEELIQSQALGEVVLDRQRSWPREIDRALDITTAYLEVDDLADAIGCGLGDQA